MKKGLFLLIFLLLFPVSCFSELSVHFIDVGEGDSILVLSDGASLLVDAGPQEAGVTVNRYIHDSLGLSGLDYVLATHEHDDHLAGMPGALSGLTVGKIFTSPFVSMTYWLKSILPVLRQGNLELAQPVHLDSFPLGSAIVTFIIPDVNSDNPNNHSIVLRIDDGATSVLLAADIEGEAEIALLEQEINLKTDLLKVAHHGGDTSTCEAFLKAVDPQFAIISVGAGNKHGHPHAGPLNNLKNRNITVYRTDLFGTIIARSNGESWSFEVSKAR